MVFRYIQCSAMILAAVWDVAGIPQTASCHISCLFVVSVYAVP